MTRPQRQSHQIEGRTPVTKNNQPELSIVIPAYNEEQAIGPLLDEVFSILEQMQISHEVIVVDDGSTDRTPEILKEFQRKEPDRIHLLLRDENLGAMRNFIETVNACGGEFLAVLEGDDFWTNPHKLQRQIDFLDEHPSCTICCHRVKHIDPKGNDLGTKFPEGIEKISG